MPLYIEKINGDVDQPTDRVNTEQSAFFENQKIEKGRDLQFQTHLSDPPDSFIKEKEETDKVKTFSFQTFDLKHHCEVNPLD